MTILERNVWRPRLPCGRHSYGFAERILLAPIVPGDGPSGAVQGVQRFDEDFRVVLALVDRLGLGAEVEEGGDGGLGGAD